jgi:hypothetical protein
MSMRFDANNIERLESGWSLKVSACQGLRLRATSRVRIWIDRYRSPVDGRMRQVRIGHWPESSLAGAIVERECLVARCREIVRAFEYLPAFVQNPTDHRQA